jgi:hypothetical protein
MRRTGIFATLTALAALSVPATSRAQAAWDRPMLMAPGSPAGWDSIWWTRTPATGSVGWSPHSTRQTRHSR